MSALRRIRVNQRMSVPMLAEQSGINEETIRNIEAGTSRNPHPKTLGKLADVLGVEPSDLDPVLTTDAA